MLEPSTPVREMKSIEELDALFDEIKSVIDEGLRQVRLRHLREETKETK